MVHGTRNMFKQLGKSDVKITRLNVFTKEKSRLVNMRADMDIQFDDEVELVRLEQTQSGRGIREGSCTSRYKTGWGRTELPHRDLGVWLDPNVMTRTIPFDRWNGLRLIKPDKALAQEDILEV